MVRPRWFYLAHVNCDCASYDHAWLRPFHSGEWPHCILCKKKLGDMEIRWLGKFKASTIGEAWEIQKRSNEKISDSRWAGLPTATKSPDKLKP